MSFAGFSFETAIRRTFLWEKSVSCGWRGERWEVRGEERRGEGEEGRERGIYILSSVCEFYLREDVAEVFGQVLCAGGVDWHCLFFLC